MLEIKSLTKIYKPKKGVPVTALDGISLKFPDKGMVFLLGKSGSGKSTLLNVLGGLDRYNQGEILIKGQSSRTFRQRHFDSYRNTYVGFIFQEYNILDEFSVGANIGLALQLQGLKPTSEQINGILREVDMDGYGNRKPNELSGGQKQRVAIARALVKNPRIIMADEPTGALDSVTGRQILTTLKKLSSDKLVIVVSHDREFAETYADRIIELEDGRVIRDVEQRVDAQTIGIPAPVFDDEAVSLPEQYVLTEADKAAICQYIQQMVDAGKAPKFTLHGEEGKLSFHDTDQQAIHTDTSGYHLIKSKLPMKVAFKLGASGLKYKRFRLVMTILLSCVAFILFGLTDTMASYSYVRTAYGSLTDPNSQVNYLAFEKEYKHYYNRSDDDFYWNDSAMTPEDYDLIREQTGYTVYPVYGNGSYSMNFWVPLELYSNLNIQEYSYYYPTSLGGYVEINEALLADLNAELVAGLLPKEGTDEIALSTFVLESFVHYGYIDAANGKTQDISSAEDLIGKTLQISDLTFTVSGIVETSLDFSRYASLKEDLTGNEEFSQQLVRLVLQQELQYASYYSLTGLGMIAPGQIEKLHETLAANQGLSNAFFLYSMENGTMSQGSYGSLDQVDAQNIVWLDGKSRTELASDEVVLSEDAYSYIMDASLGEAVNFRTQYESENPDYSCILAHKMSLGMEFYTSNSYESQQIEAHIVGIIPSEYEEEYRHLISREYLDRAGSSGDTPMIMQTIAAMPTDNREILTLVEFSDTEFTKSDGTVVRFNLMNPVTFELRNLDEIFLVLRSVFLWIGLVFVVFASLLFSNFIATSISYKKREIGILRAIGSRSNDVFRIFFAESFIIAMINFVLSLAGTVGICSLINWMLRSQAGLLLTVLNVGIRQIALLFGICLLVAAVASFLPVRRIAAKRPIDAIRDR